MSKKISQSQIDLLRKTAKNNSNPIGILKYGVVGELIESTENACNAKFKNLRGWTNKNDVWGC